VIIRPASNLAQDRESSPVKDQRSTTVLRRQLNVLFFSGKERNGSIAKLLFQRMFTSPD